MKKSMQIEKTSHAFSWRKTARKVFYFGVPIALALCSVVFPISTFLRQAMIGFMLIWFVAGSWMFASPK
jgi:hypothetical protein